MDTYNSGNIRLRTILSENNMILIFPDDKRVERTNLGKCCRCAFLRQKKIVFLLLLLDVKCERFITLSKYVILHTFVLFLLNAGEGCCSAEQIPHKMPRVLQKVLFLNIMCLRRFFLLCEISKVLLNEISDEGSVSLIRNYKMNFGNFELNLSIGSFTFPNFN